MAGLMGLSTIDVVLDIKNGQTQLSRAQQLAARIDQLGAMQAAFLAKWNLQFPLQAVTGTALVYEDPTTNKPFTPIV